MSDVLRKTTVTVKCDVCCVVHEFDDGKVVLGDEVDMDVITPVTIGRRTYHACTKTRDPSCIKLLLIRVGNEI